MIDGSTYYKSQSQARGIREISDVKRMVVKRTHIYDRILLAQLLANRECAIYEAATGPGILQAWLQDRGFSNLHGSDFLKKRRPWRDKSRKELSTGIPSPIWKIDFRNAPSTPSLHWISMSTFPASDSGIFFK